MDPEHDDALSSDAQEFLASVRGADDPSPADRVRIKKAVGAAIATTGAAASSTVASSAAAASTVATGTGLAIGTKLTVAALVVSGLGAAVVLGAPALVTRDRGAAPGPSAAVDDDGATTDRASAAEPVERGDAARDDGVTPENLTPPGGPLAMRAPGDDRSTVASEAETRRTVAETPPPRSVVEPEAPRRTRARADQPAPLAETEPARSPRTRADQPAPLAESETSAAARNLVDEAEALAEPTASEGAGGGDRDSALRSELALMQQARAAEARGDHARAIGLLREHQTRFSAGLLAIERDAALALALCRAGAPEGPSLGARFLAGHPSHPLAERVTQACDLLR